MRIAIISESFAPDVNGVARSVVRVAEHPVRRGHQPLVIAPTTELIAGYVGRLAAEKRVDLLADACRRPGLRVVAVGDGPARRDLERALPGAAVPGRAARAATCPH
jgi:phosphatidylinositol alpha 1,6-mannosyltransferase